MSKNLKSISPSCIHSHTEQRGDRSRSHARTVQMNELKFRAPSAHPRHPWFIREVWWRWLLRRPRSALWVTESTGGKYWGNLSFAPTDLEGQCAYSITRCGVSAWLGKWGLAGGFFWKVSDKLSPCPPPTPFPNPARSCFADRSARRRETRAPQWDYFTVYTRSGIGFLSRPRHIISIALSALKDQKKKGCFMRKNLESSSKPSSVTVCMKKMWCNDHTQNARKERRDNPLFGTLVSFHITALTLTHLQRHKYQTLQHAISIQRAKPGWCAVSTIFTHEK